jgi:hypothetical protein
MESSNWPRPKKAIQWRTKRFNYFSRRSQLRENEQKKVLIEIWGYHIGDYVEYYFLECYAAQSGKLFFVDIPRYFKQQE